MTVTVNQGRLGLGYITGPGKTKEVSWHGAKRDLNETAGKLDITETGTGEMS